MNRNRRYVIGQVKFIVQYIQGGCELNFTWAQPKKPGLENIIGFCPEFDGTNFPKSAIRLGQQGDRYPIMFDRVDDEEINLQNDVEYAALVEYYPVGEDPAAKEEVFILGVGSVVEFNQALTALKSSYTTPTPVVRSSSKPKLEALPVSEYTKGHFSCEVVLKKRRLFAVGNLLEVVNGLATQLGDDPSNLLIDEGTVIWKEKKDGRYVILTTPPEKIPPPSPALLVAVRKLGAKSA